MTAIDYRGRELFNEQYVDLSELIGETLNDRLEDKLQKFFLREEELFYLNSLEKRILLRGGYYKNSSVPNSNNYELELIENNDQCIIINLNCNGNVIEVFQENKKHD